MAVTDDAIEKIKAMIVSGELRPGDRLPNEVELAERLGLSRNSLREAVRALTLLRVLDTRQGAGTYVTSLEPSLLLETLSFVVDFHRDDTVLQLMEVRRLLEPHAAAMAATRISEDELATMRNTLDALREPHTTQEVVVIDAKFHGTIARASGNPALASILDNLLSSTTPGPHPAWQPRWAIPGADVQRARGHLPGSGRAASGCCLCRRGRARRQRRALAAYRR